MTYVTIRDQFLQANDGNPVFAASALALALMEDGRTPRLSRWSASR